MALLNSSFPDRVKKKKKKKHPSKTETNIDKILINSKQ